jgi:hypothetical protein
MLTDANSEDSSSETCDEADIDKEETIIKYYFEAEFNHTFSC